MGADGPHAVIVKMKIYQREIDRAVEQFTVGNDFELDNALVKHDCIASIVHAKALKRCKLLNETEFRKLEKSLKDIIRLHRQGKFEIKIEDEDCHTAIENHLVKKFGDVGKKIHTARSRNDQVLTALRLYEKEQIQETFDLIKILKESLKAKTSTIPMPGYTHMRKAMPATIGMWLGSFIEALADSEELLDEVGELVDRSPLGTAAGFGVPIAINRKMVAAELGFRNIIKNPMYAQMSRGKVEAALLHALSQIMFDLNKLATDLALFSMDEFGYVTLPTKLCTGSSIMPQKKNPDVLELVRAQYHVVLGEQFKVQSMIGNLMSGYNRDLQLTKEPVMKTIEITQDCLKIMTLVVKGLKINKAKIKKAMTKELYATEEAYKLVKKGVPFRDAFKQISIKFK